MRSVHTFRVIPNLPVDLEFLYELAYNLWWCWNQDARHLFREIDPEVWDTVGHNPVKLLATVRQERLEQLSVDEGFLSFLDEIKEQFDDYMQKPSLTGSQDELKLLTRKPGTITSKPTHLWETTWYKERVDDGQMLVAYFSAEFGLDAALPIYSGGLGVLAGDHLKSASDLGVPLVAVGLCYHEGYFRQYLNPDGWQQERYPPNEFYSMPMTLEYRGGKPILIDVLIGERIVKAQIWRVQVGRVPLFLLDTNIVENHEDDRRITARLYGGTPEDRLKQEIVLGIGGTRALETLGLEPTVLHLNEGHAAFAALERCRKLVLEKGLQFAEAQEAVAGTTVFTTHTPVPAGNQIYSLELMGRYFHHFWPELKLGEQAFYAMGRKNPFDTSEAFGMTVLALRISRFRNGVSRLHGRVSREMWQSVWPEVPKQEVPISHITNGIHIPTWISAEINGLFNRYLGPRWLVDTTSDELWQRVEKIPVAEMWRSHERRREALVAYCRARLRKQLAHRGAPRAEIDKASEVLDPEALTFAFARRFATYKRATLIFSDMDRMQHLLQDRERPLQIIIAGKAHPRDEPGKQFIQKIAKLSKRPDFRRSVVFIEDYDMGLASYLVQGADVWLNNPRRPHEASGTSGMKAGVNGVLNCSILDGWWDEAFDGDNGWAIGNGEEYPDEQAVDQDDIESRALYQLLESEILPMFYDRGSDNIPHRWVARMKRAIRTVAPVFNTSRMVKDYAEMFYMPAQERRLVLVKDDFQAARELGEYIERVRHEWHQLKISDLKLDASDTVSIGSRVNVSATVHLGNIQPDEVAVDVCQGRVARVDQIAEITQTTPMTVQENLGNGTYRMAGSVPCMVSGHVGIAIRVLPHHAHLLPNDRTPGLIYWA